MTNLVRIGNCYSGLFIKGNSPYRRIAVATPVAKEKFSENPLLQAAAQKTPPSKNVFKHQGIVPEIFVGWKDNLSLGLCLKDQAEDQEIYDEEKARLESPQRGFHRQIFFKMQGIDVSAELADLSPHLYAALLAKIKTEYNTGSFQGISSISIWDRKFDRIEKREDGNALMFSLNQLTALATKVWAHIEKD